MKKDDEKKLEKKAIIGSLLIFLSFILMIDFNDPINSFFGNFTIVISIVIAIYGMSLLFPYISNLNNQNKI